MGKTTSVRIDENLYKRLKAEAKREGRTITWLLKEAVKAYLNPDTHVGGV